MSNTSWLRKVLFVLGPVAIVIALVVGMASTTNVAEAGKNLANGMKCKFDSDCESNRCSFNVCKARSGGGGGKQLGNGASCKFDSDCESHRCSFNVCKAKGGSGKQLGNGAACKFDSDCESHRCSFNKCKSR